MILTALGLVAGAMFAKEYLKQRATFLRMEGSMQRMSHSLRSIDSPEQAEWAVEVWGIWMTNNAYGGYPTWEVYSRRLARERSAAISNVVAGLESYSGLRFGTNLYQWQSWVAAGLAEEID